MVDVYQNIVTITLRLILLFVYNVILDFINWILAYVILKIVSISILLIGHVNNVNRLLLIVSILYKMKVYVLLINVLLIKLLIMSVGNVNQVTTIFINYKLSMDLKHVCYNVALIMNLSTLNVNLNIAQIITQMESVLHVLQDTSLNHQLDIVS